MAQRREERELEEVQRERKGLEELLMEAQEEERKARKHEQRARDDAGVPVFFSLPPSLVV